MGFKVSAALYQNNVKSLYHKVCGIHIHIAVSSTYVHYNTSTQISRTIVGLTVSKLVTEWMGRLENFKNSQQTYIAIVMYMSKHIIWSITKLLWSNNPIPNVIQYKRIRLMCTKYCNLPLISAAK